MCATGGPGGAWPPQYFGENVHSSQKKGTLQFLSHYLGGCNIMYHVAHALILHMFAIRKYPTSRFDLFMFFSSFFHILGNLNDPCPYDLPLTASLVLFTWQSMSYDQVWNDQIWYSSPYKWSMMRGQDHLKGIDSLKTAQLNLGAVLRSIERIDSFPELVELMDFGRLSFTN